LPQFTLLRGARQLLTLAGPDGVRCGSALQSLSVISEGSVLIEDGIIAEVGSTRRIENLKQSRDAIEIDVHGSVVMPGFVDPSLRVTLNSAPGGTAKRPKRMSQLYEETLELLRSCVVNGTLTAELKGGAALEGYHSDFGVLRRLAKIGNNPAATVRTWQLGRIPQSDSEVSDFCSVLLKVARKQLIQFVEITLGDDTPLPNDLVNGLAAAGVGAKLCWSGGHAEPLTNVLNRLQPFSVFCSKILTPEELQVLKGYRGTVIFAPGRELNEAGLTAARVAIDAGLPVALSSGYDAASYPAYSMQMAVSLATVYGHLTLEEAISAATVNAAHAIGCGDILGSLMKGRRADVLVLNLPDYRDIPRQFGINNVRMAIRDGAVVMNRTGWKIGTHETPLASRVRAQRVGGA
jgi:imidazolonepropionase